VNRPIRFSELASAELTQAVHWYETQRSGLGAELLDAVDSTVARIETNPEVGTPTRRRPPDPPPLGKALPIKLFTESGPITLQSPPWRM